MGNQLAQPQKVAAEHLAELNDLVATDTLGGGRFLKTWRCRHDDGGLVVVKVYYKRSDVGDLRVYAQRLNEIRSRLAGIACPHVWPFQDFRETDGACYLLRQYVFANLYHRLSTRPFLSGIEKKWIAYQMLEAVAQAHERGVCHGDIKCENVLVTSWNWVYLTDFASYKPTWLPADNPADFSFYFDTGGRRRCYIAPERFYDSAGGADAPSGPLQPAMDIFALGCTLAELFLEGTAFFDLSKLLAYRRGEYDPSLALAQVDKPIRDLILHMIQPNPARRLTAAKYVEHYSQRVFPPYFCTLFHPFFGSLLTLDSDTRVTVTEQAFPRMKQEFQGIGSKYIVPEPAAAAAAAAAADGQQNALSGARSGSAPPAPTAKPSAGGAATSPGPSSRTRSPTAAAQQRPDLMGDVGALLADTQSLLQRLQEDGPSGATDDDGFFLGDSALAGGIQLDEQYIGPGDAAEASAAGSASASASALHSRSSSGLVTGSHSDEVATEQWYEQQSRTTCGGGSDFSPAPGADVQRKEEVGLPPEGGWQWAGGWQVDNQGGGCDAEGWMYRSPADPADPQPAASTSHSHQRWHATCTEEMTQRQRRWVRRRRRRPTPHSSASGIMASAGMLAAADESLGQIDGMILIAVLLCTLVCGAKLQESKARAVALLAEASELCNDDTRVQRIIPYLIAAIGEPLSSVRCTALRCLGRVLASVQALSPSDAKIFNEYILPSLSMVPNDGEESVRVEYAAAIPQLAATAQRYLQRLQHLTASTPNLDPASPALVKYDMEMAVLRLAVEKVVHELVVGARSSSATRHALLPRLHLLAAFLGRRESNDFLLPTMITFLNDRDWPLRAAFFAHIACLGAYAGAGGLEAFLLPCLENALADAEEAVIAEALGFLTAAAAQGLLRKRALLVTAAKVAPKLRHPSTSVRAAAVMFVATAAAGLSPADTYAQLLPAVSPALRAEPASLASPQDIVECLAPPNGTHALPTISSAAALVSHLSTPRPPLSPSASSADVARAASREGLASLRGARSRGGSTSSLSGSAGSQGPAQVQGQSPNNSSLHERSIPDENAAAASDRGAMLSPAGAPLYLVKVEERFTAPSSSLLGAALDSMARSTSDGHLIARSGARTGPSAAPGGVSAATAALRLLAHAARLAPRPSGPELSGRLSLSMEEPLSLPAPSGPSGVVDAVAAAMSTDLPSAGGGGGGVGGGATAAARSSPWHPKGILVGHMAEHRGPVNELAVAGNGAFFVSASSDGTTKVWDCGRLEKDVSFRSRLTYSGQEGAVLAAAGCEEGQSIASGSSGGSLHVWRVDYTCRAAGTPDRYTGLIARAQVDPGEGAVLAVAQSGRLLLYSTQHGGVHAWDLRAGKDAWRLPCVPREGMMAAMATDPAQQAWLVTGSSRGQLALWDQRFQLRVNAWRHPLACPIDAMAPALAPLRRLGMADAARGGPLVYVAAGPDEVGLWDVEQGACVQVLRVAGPGESEAGRREVPAALSPPQLPAVSNPLDAGALAEHLAQRQLTSPEPRIAGCRAVLASGAGVLLTGSTDCRLRLWDAAHPERSYVICGPPTAASIGAAAEGQPATGAGIPTSSYSRRLVAGVPVIEEACTAATNGGARWQQGWPISHVERMESLAHHDSITHLACIEVAERLLLSASRDGVIKAWK